jgi:hypothetical protein
MDLLLEIYSFPPGFFGKSSERPQEGGLEESEIYRDWGVVERFKAVAHCWQLDQWVDKDLTDISG